MHQHWHENDVDQLPPDVFRAYCAASPEYVNERDDFDYTPLIAACMKRNAAVARVLLDAGADPNFVAPDGESPLKAAIPGPNNPINRELFDLLLAAGANPNIGSEPPLHIAVVRGHRELVAYLVEHGADPNLDDADGSPPLFWAGVYGRQPDIKTMRVLIKLGADISRCDGVGQTVEDRIGKEAMQEAMRRCED